MRNRLVSLAVTVFIFGGCERTALTEPDATASSIQPEAALGEAPGSPAATFQSPAIRRWPQEEQFRILFEEVPGGYAGHYLDEGNNLNPGGFIGDCFP